MYPAPADGAALTTPAAAPPRIYRVLILGATSAIAIATARLLAKPGTHFYLVARSRGKLDTVAADLRVRGAGAVATTALDLDDTAAHPPLLAHAVATLGSIDLALIAHGVLGDQHQSEMSYPAAAAVLHTNLLSAVSAITWLANYFEEQKRGTLAVISSVAGDRGRKSNYVYGASKGALSIFLDGVRNRIDRSGVQVLTIKPGFVATPMTHRDRPRHSARHRPAARRSLSAGVLGDYPVCDSQNPWAHLQENESVAQAQAKSATSHACL
jgi:decaprenylphospho-beta-D-erythro-pentofuranosid-2-ulose 2-reductase